MENNERKKINPLKGFKVLQAKYSKSSAVKRQLFIKEHNSRKDSAKTPLGKTLFIVNIPPWVTAESLKNAFEDHVNKVESVNLNPYNNSATRHGYQTGYIVFPDSKSLHDAMQLKEITFSSTKPLVNGMKKWIEEYNCNYESEDSLRRNAVLDIENYDQYRNKTNEQLKVLSKTTDDEGWTVVTRTNGSYREENVQEKVAKKEEDKKKKKTLLNFYRFQIREARKEQLVALRKKVEEDKNKINVMKSRKAFNPF